jgi:hypothetical protein
MDGVFEQVLDNDKTQARITIFRDAGAVRRLWYKLKDFWGLLKHDKESGKIMRSFRYCWNAHYIYMALE